MKPKESEYEKLLLDTLYEVDDHLYGPGRRRVGSGEQHATLLLARATILATLYKIEVGE